MARHRGTALRSTLGVALVQPAIFTHYLSQTAKRRARVRAQFGTKHITRAHDYTSGDFVNHFAVAKELAFQWGYGGFDLHAARTRKGYVFVIVERVELVPVQQPEPSLSLTVTFTKTTASRLSAMLRDFSDEHTNDYREDES